MQSKTSTMSKLSATIIFSVLLLLLALTAEAFVMNRITTHPSRQLKFITTRFMSENDYDMDVGDFQNCVFKKAGVVKQNVSKYTIDATIDAKALNSYLVEYQDEMKRRKVVFPGFRPGKLPPYVMGDVRKYLVCYGLETMIGQLCNSNGLKVSILVIRFILVVMLFIYVLCTYLLI